MEMGGQVMEMVMEMGGEGNGQNYGSILAFEAE